MCPLGLSAILHPISMFPPTRHYSHKCFCCVLTTKLDVHHYGQTLQSYCTHSVPIKYNYKRWVGMLLILEKLLIAFAIRWHTKACGNIHKPQCEVNDDQTLLFVCVFVCVCARAAHAHTHTHTHTHTCNTVNVMVCLQASTRIRLRTVTLTINTAPCGTPAVAPGG